VRTPIWTVPAIGSSKRVAIFGSLVGTGCHGGTASGGSALPWTSTTLDCATFTSRPSASVA
jgi:hypothetical protein